MIVGIVDEVKNFGVVANSVLLELLYGFIGALLGGTKKEILKNNR